jgi:hypothetical protein
MGAAIAALWGFARSPAGKIIALILVAAIAGTVIYYRGKSDGAAEVGAKVNSETLKAAKESRQEGERIKREVESEPDRDLIECLRNGSC